MSEGTQLDQAQASDGGSPPLIVEQNQALGSTEASAPLTPQQDHVQGSDSATPSPVVRQKGPPGQVDHDIADSAGEEERTERSRSTAEIATSERPHRIRKPANIAPYEPTRQFYGENYKAFGDRKPRKKSSGTASSPHATNTTSKPLDDHHQRLVKVGTRCPAAAIRDVLGQSMEQIKQELLATETRLCQASKQTEHYLASVEAKLGKDPELKQHLLAIETKVNQIEAKLGQEPELKQHLLAIETKVDQNSERLEQRLTRVETTLDQIAGLINQIKTGVEPSHDQGFGLGHIENHAEAPELPSPSAASQLSGDQTDSIPANPIKADGNKSSSSNVGGRKRKRVASTGVGESCEGKSGRIETRQLRSRPRKG
ncbi:hypothetical protein UCRPC4_g03193 [Phaeomoniella chlamydospora]|uniref:Uncharacterized protein n=1 Tax=Phaeomoniella chlamydospora TaxID=158046 RepID=A0A0G2H1L1_PHACM|nr:hypothetical protein UCRPC4_g03193 [Phaeomoniella chlamydospora]